MYRVYYKSPETQKWVFLSQFVNRGAAAMEYEVLVRKGYQAKVS